MNKNVRKITEGAMMCAIIGVILFFNRQFAGMFELYFMWVIPLPILLYTIRYNVKDALVVVASVVFITFLFGTIQTIFYIVMALGCGLMYGYGVRKHYSNLRLLIQTAAITTLSAIISMVIFAAFFGYNVIEEIQFTKDMVLQAVPNADVLFPMGIDHLIMMCFYLGTILSGVMEAIIVHVFSLVILKRFGIKSNPMTPINEIRIPKWSAYVMFICTILMRVITVVDVPPVVVDIVYVLGIISSLVLFGFGFIFCLVFGMLKYKKNITLILVVIVLFTFAISVPLLVALGFLYQTTNIMDMLIRR